jgi:hypothetical protein
VSLPRTDAKYQPDDHASYKADCDETPENAPANTSLLLPRVNIFKKLGKIR